VIAQDRQGLVDLVAEIGPVVIAVKFDIGDARFLQAGGGIGE
jgi:hypothetical protein